MVSVDHWMSGAGGSSFCSVGAAGERTIEGEKTVNPLHAEDPGDVAVLEGPPEKIGPLVTGDRG